MENPIKMAEILLIFPCFQTFHLATVELWKFLLWQGETYAEDAEGGKDAEPGSLTVTEEDRQGGDGRRDFPKVLGWVFLKMGI